jgi:hypothetical protein
MEGLDNLLSVAEAFELSQQPDFNDITNPGMLVILSDLCNQTLLKILINGCHLLMKLASAKTGLFDET